MPALRRSQLPDSRQIFPALGSAAVDCALRVGSARRSRACFLPGKQPIDVRLGPLRDLDGYFPYAVAPSRRAMANAGRELRQQLLVALGLWPLPAKTPLNPVIHGRLEQDDYTRREGLLREHAGVLRDGQPLPAAREIRPVPRRVVSPRPLAQRTVLRLRARGDQETDRAGRRAVRR